MWVQITRTVMEARSNDDPATPKNQDPKESESAKPKPTGEASQSMSAPSVVRAGEIMLIFSLLLIFLVACCVALHFYLRSRKRKAKHSKSMKDKKTKKNKKGGPKGPPELHSQEKKIAELVGTPVCEMGDSEPRHEMEHVLTPIDEPIGSAISTYGPVAIPVPAFMRPQTAPEPETPAFARYWSARM